MSADYSFLCLFRMMCNGQSERFENVKDLRFFIFAPRKIVSDNFITAVLFAISSFRTM